MYPHCYTRFQTRSIYKWWPESWDQNNVNDRLFFSRIISVSEKKVKIMFFSWAKIYLLTTLNAKYKTMKCKKYQKYLWSCFKRKFGFAKLVWTTSNAMYITIKKKNQSYGYYACYACSIPGAGVDDDEVFVLDLVSRSCLTGGRDAGFPRSWVDRLVDDASTQ